jgi:hypothetical protein
MSGILQGVDALIDAALGLPPVGSPPYYRSKSACLSLAMSQCGGVNLAETLYDAILTNWQSGGSAPCRSHQNWRWEPQPDVALNNTSREKLLEKAIARHLGDCWTNQVPVASGVVGSGDRHRAVDLAHRVAPGHYELVELKVESNTPLMAAMELLGYGVLYLFSRLNARELGYDTGHGLLSADKLGLRVLAPKAYYSPYSAPELCALEARLTADLASFTTCGSGALPLKLDFQFQSFSGSACCCTKADAAALVDSIRPLCTHSCG